MAVCDDCFHEFLHPLVHEAMKKNKQFEERYGRHKRWDWDDTASTLTFSDDGVPKVRVQVSVVGTAEGDSWEWSWANPNIPLHAKVGIDKVRAFGEAEGYEKLMSRFLEADEYTGWEMTAVAVHVLESPGSYRFPTNRGYCYLAYRKVEELDQTAQIDLHGAMADTITISPGTDLTSPTGEDWEAESESSRA